eukprot:3712737-Rhodomonas_salina.3
MPLGFAPLKSFNISLLSFAMGDKVEVLVAAGNRLGECPIWDDRRNMLVWIDCPGQKFWQYDAATKESKSYDLPGVPGSFALTEKDGVYLLAMDNAFHRWSEVEGFLGEPIVVPEAELNDGCVDKQGRFVCGGLQVDISCTDSKIYRIDSAGKLETLIEGISCTNGIGFSVDGQTMYFTDSRWDPPRLASVDYTRWDHHPAASGPAPPAASTISVDSPHISTVFTWPSSTGMDSQGKKVFPLGFVDGLCVDSQGGVWVAAYGGGRLVRVLEGAEVASAPLPIPHPTRACLGGPDLCTLFVTNASVHRKVDSPHAGAVHAVTVSVPGLPERRFGS